MIKSIKNSISMLLVMTVILGLIYPLAMTGLAQGIFPHQAKGSLAKSAYGEVVGSTLIGQNFSKPEYFHGRPSAAGANGYDAAASSGSNLGPTSKKLAEAVKLRIEAVRKENNLPDHAPIPSDLVTASSSGLDPHISVASATLQVERIAKLRNLSANQVQKLISEHKEVPFFFFLGQEKVNVLELNMALDHMVK